MPRAPIVSMFSAKLRYKQSQSSLFALTTRWFPALPTSSKACRAFQLRFASVSIFSAFFFSGPKFMLVSYWLEISARLQLITRFKSSSTWSNEILRWSVSSSWITFLATERNHVNRAVFELLPELTRTFSQPIRRWQQQQKKTTIETLTRAYYSPLLTPYFWFWIFLSGLPRWEE